MSLLTSNINPNDELRRTFDQFFTPQSRVILGSLRVPYSKSAQFSTEAAQNELIATPAQTAVSRLFGKNVPSAPCIGDHPDFLELKGTDDYCYCPITTMFMDIESSTRLGLLYPPETVFRVKNAFIQTAIEIIRSFGGHVHRIMGDSVMAYFGGRMTTVESSIIDCINCSAVLRHFAENVVHPKLQDEGINHDFGIRIGLDFGPEKDVLWRSYGSPGVEEVTATSYYVDVAAKLQQAAPRNQAMMGQSIISTICFPDELLKVKTITQDGSPVNSPIVLPNYTGKDGCSINYKQMQLLADSYLFCTPFGQQKDVLKRPLGGVKSVRVMATIHPKQYSLVNEGEYHPASRAIPKNKWLKFSVQLPYQPMLPYEIRCIVENHGQEAAIKGGETLGNHTDRYQIETQHQHTTFSHWEYTAYRGLHYMTIEVWTHQGLEYRTRFGVYVE